MKRQAVGAGQAPPKPELDKGRSYFDVLRDSISDPEVLKAARDAEVEAANRDQAAARPPQ